MLAVVGLVDAAHVADVGARGEPHPHLDVSGVREFGVVAADLLLERCAHDHLGGGDAAVRLLEAALQPPRAGEDRGAAQLGPGRGQRCAVLEVDRVAVDEADLRVGVQQPDRPGQRAGGEPVVGREQHGVVAVGPLQQAFVVGGDVPLVDRMDPDLDPGIAGGQLQRGLGRVVGRAVVDDQDPDVDARLLVQHAADAVGEIVPVLVARDHHAHGAHYVGVLSVVGPSGAGPLPSAGRGRTGSGGAVSAGGLGQGGGRRRGDLAGLGARCCRGRAAGESPEETSEQLLQWSQQAAQEGEL